MSYDVVRLRVEFANDEVPWMYPMALNGREIDGIYVDDVKHVPYMGDERQLSEYVYALECALIYGYDNSDAACKLVEEMRHHFAPDVKFPFMPFREVED